MFLRLHPNRMRSHKIAEPRVLILLRQRWATDEIAVLKVRKKRKKPRIDGRTTNIAISFAPPGRDLMRHRQQLFVVIAIDLHRNPELLQTTETIGGSSALFCPTQHR